MTLIEENMKRTVAGVASAFGATAEVDFRLTVRAAGQRSGGGDARSPTSPPIWSARTTSTAIASLILASEDFSFMLEARPGAYINIGNGDKSGSPAQSELQFQRRDAAARRRHAGLVEKKLPRSLSA